MRRADRRPSRAAGTCCCDPGLRAAEYSLSILAVGWFGTGRTIYTAVVERGPARRSRSPSTLINLVAKGGCRAAGNRGKRGRGVRAGGRAKRGQSHERHGVAVG